MIRGSYYNGFAPRDGMPLYPSLWRGCVGAWAPCLGPTGLALRDWSGFGRHGTLTNMDAGFDWVISQGRYALDFDGTDDGVIAQQILISGGKMSVSAWIRPADTSGLRIIAAQYGSGAIDRGWYLAILNGSIRFLVSPNGSLVPSGNGGTITANEWTHVAGVLGASAFQIYVNGAAVSTSLTGTFPTTIFNSSVQSAIGIRDGGDGQFVGLIDEVMIHSRVLLANEIELLASRRGIAYDLAPFRMPYSEQVAGFQAAWALRQRLILGGGGGLG